MRIVRKINVMSHIFAQQSKEHWIVYHLPQPRIGLGDSHQYQLAGGRRQSGAHDELSLLTSGESNNAKAWQSKAARAPKFTRRDDSPRLTIPNKRYDRFRVLGDD